MKTSLIALGLLTALPFAASATDGLSYNYVQGGYVGTNTDAGDADGFGLGGSVAVHPNVHLFGNYTSQNVDGVNAAEIVAAIDAAVADGMHVINLSILNHF